MILVTGATGMFGGRVVEKLRERDVPVRALVHRGGAERLAALGAEPVTGDMDDAATLGPALEGVDTVFLVSPMDDRIREREGNVLAVAQDAGVERIVKLYGAVEHRGDALDVLHRASIDAIRASGLHWSLVSPSSVMETSLLSQAEAIRQGAIYACAGDGKVGHVAADDVARAAAAVLVDGAPDGANHRITGPQSLSLGEVAAIMSDVLGREIRYVDMPEDAFRDLLVDDMGMTPEAAELGVLVHFRAWKRGDADLVTDTHRELTGLEPTPLADWVAANRDAFTP
ncbi:MAG: NmrA family NAD(P)-binding protein [Solirubrobacteraceae bacterium]|nr:NmrA family NAD(P)-binding protein [Solirubrobacteraceae bacterium]